jgi:hypothetical protein
MGFFQILIKLCGILLSEHNTVVFEFSLFVKSLLLFNINYLNMLNVSIHSYLVPYPVYFGMIKQLITQFIIVNVGPLASENVHVRKPKLDLPE